MAVLDVERAALHRKEHDFGVEAVDDVVGGVGQQPMVMFDSQIGRCESGFSYREADEPRVRVDRLRAKDLIERQRLRLQEHRGIGGQNDVGLYPDLFQQLPGMAIPHRDEAGTIERISHSRAKPRVHERTRADPVHHDRRSHLVCQEHIAQVSIRVGVVQDASAAEDEQIETADHLLRLPA